MQKTTLPHAIGESVIRDFPDSSLYVATTLGENPGDPNFDAEAKHELMQAIARRLADDDDLQAYDVQWNYKG